MLVQKKVSARMKEDEEEGEVTAKPSEILQAESYLSPALSTGLSIILKVFDIPQSCPR